MELSDVLSSLGHLTSEAIVVAEMSACGGLEMRWSNPAFDALAGSDAACPLTRFFKSDATMQARMDRGAPFEERMICHSRDDGSFTAEVRFHPAGQVDGQAAYWMIFVQPVAEPAGEMDIRDDLAMVAESASDMITILTPKGQILWANRSFWTTTQYSPRELAGLGMDQLIRMASPDDDLSGGFADIAEAFATGRPAKVQVLCRRKDETRYWADIGIEPICDQTGKVQKFLCLIRDITRQQSRNIVYNALFDQSSSALIVKKNDIYVRANQTYLDQIGRSAEELIGKRTDDLYDAGTAKRFSRIEAEILRTGRPFHDETEVETRDGRTVHHVTKRFRIHDPAYDEYMIGIVGMDVTDIRRAQRATEAAEQRLWSAINALSDGFMLTDKDDNVVLINQAFRDMHGAAGSMIELNKPATEGVRHAIAAGVWDIGDQSPDEYLKAYMENRNAIPEGGDVVGLADGRWLMRRQIVLPNGEMVGLRIDVTDVKSKEAALEVAQQDAEQARFRLVEAIEALDDAFVLFDRNHQLVLCNQKFRNLYASTLVDLKPGLSFAEIEDIKTEAGVILPPSGVRKPVGPTPQRHVEEALSDGRHLSISHRKTLGEDTVGLYVDVTNLKKHQESLEAARSDMEYISLHDALTGLSNRRYLDQALRKGCKSRRSYGVLHIDLDRFKQINDTLGHHAGDQILIHAARILNSCTDIEDCVARVGGDEFVVIVWDPESEQIMIDIAERLIHRMSRPFYFNGHECRFGCSIGIFLSAPGSADTQQALINADIALYKAKNEGRSRHAVFTPALQVEILETKQLADALLYGLEQGEFVAYYQPQFDAHTREIVGAEALVRWHSNTLGTRTPDKFLEVAEGLNVVASVDRAVLQHVASDLAIWRADGLEPPCISVNISSQRLLSDQLVEDLKDLKFKPSELSIELLESIFLDNERDIAKWRLDQLREMGFRLELDDFGTGHASILSLLKLEPSRLKIDRQFVMPIVESAAKANLVQSIIEIGRSIGVGVVAEGVETAEHADLLEELGCDTLQGYHFARPMPSREFADFMANHRHTKMRMRASR